MIGSAVGQVEQASRPGGLERGDEVAPEVVLGGPVDGVVLAVEVIDREAAGDRLLVVGLGGAGACGSPVWSWPSAPVTNSTPAIGSRSPSSVASRK